MEGSEGWYMRRIQSPRYVSGEVATKVDGRDVRALCPASLATAKYLVNPPIWNSKRWRLMKTLVGIHYAGQLLPMTIFCITVKESCEPAQSVLIKVCNYLLSSKAEVARIDSAATCEAQCLTMSRSRNTSGLLQHIPIVLEVVFGDRILSNSFSSTRR